MRALAYSAASSVHSRAMPVASAAYRARVRSTSARRAPVSSSASAPSTVIARGTTGRVEVLRRLDGDAGALEVDHRDVVADRHEHDVREPAADHRADRTRGLPAVDGDVAVERDRTDDRAVGEAGQETVGRRSRRGREHGARDHRRDERPGGDGAPELLDHDDQLAQAEARPAVGLGEVEAEPAEPGHVRPEVGERLLAGLEQRPGRTPGVPLLQELGGGLAEGAVVVGDRDRHRAGTFVEVRIGSHRMRRARIRVQTRG